MPGTFDELTDTQIIMAALVEIMSMLRFAAGGTVKRPTEHIALNNSLLKRIKPGIE